MQYISLLSLRYSFILLFNFSSPQTAKASCHLLYQPTQQPTNITAEPEAYICDGRMLCECEPLHTNAATNNASTMYFGWMKSEWDQKEKKVFVNAKFS